MSSTELRNQKLAELRKQKETGLKKIPLFRDIGIKPEPIISGSFSPDDNFSTDAQIASIPGSSLLLSAGGSSPLSIPPSNPIPNPTFPQTSSKKSEIDRLQSLISSKQRSIESLQHLKSSLSQENNEIRQSTNKTLEKQSSIRLTYTLKVIKK